MVRLTAHTVYSSATVTQLEEMDCEQLRTCVFFFCRCCLSLIRTYMVQVQKQAQEQGLFPPVKWVWVKCIFIFSHPGSFKKKKQQGLCKLASVSCLWTFTSFLPSLSLPPCSCTSVFHYYMQIIWDQIGLEQFSSYSSCRQHDVLNCPRGKCMQYATSP